MGGEECFRKEGVLQTIENKGASHPDEGRLRPQDFELTPASRGDDTGCRKLSVAGAPGIRPAKVLYKLTERT